MDNQTTLPAEAFILAGGASQRFGSDKARYLLNGSPMLAVLAANLDPHFEGLSVVAKRPGEYDDLGLRTLGDRYPEQAALSGVLTALELSTGDWTFVCACDLPNLTGEFCRRLWADRGTWGVAPMTEGRLHPLAAWYHRESHAHLLAAYKAGQFGLHRIWEHPNFAKVGWERPETLQNLNRPPRAGQLGESASLK